MLTLAPRSACTSPLVLSLLVEVLSLQIWSTIQSLNSDFINTTIVSSFGQAVTAVKEVQKDTQEAEAKRQTKMSTESDGHDNDLETVLETTENGRIVPLDAITELSSGDINKVMAGSGILPPPLPVRKTPAVTRSNDPAPDANARKPPQTISLDSPDHTFAASGIPSYGMMAPTPAAYAPSRKSLDAKTVESSSAPTASGSWPNSVPNSPRGIPARLEDRTIEEALDHGAAKLKAFGKGLFSAGQKLLDAAILPEDGTGPGHARQASEGGTHSRRGSVQLPQSPRAPSLKGKERALDLDDPADTATGSPVPSSPSTSVKSPSMARDPSRKSVASFGSGFGSFISPPSSRPSSIFGSGIAPPTASTAQLSARDKLQIAIDILKSKDTDRCAHLAQQLERSLFSKDLALLFPAPQDDQLRAILARHTAVEELVDPTLIGLSDEFHAYLERDASGTGERLLRLWTQLDHFGYMVEMTKPTLDQLYDDTLGLLQKTINQMDDIPFATADAGAEERACITACEMTMLRLQQNLNREIFEPLQDWLIKSIQEKYWDAFMKEKAGKEGIGMPRPPAMERVPSASTSKRTLDSIPNTSSSAFADDGDLGMSMRDEDDARHSTTATNGNTSHAAIAPAAPTGLTPSSSAASLPAVDEVQIPAFSVTLTDLSPPSAYLNNHVKSRKDLEFLIAVEVEGSPGYIVSPRFEYPNIFAESVYRSSHGSTLNLKRWMQESRRPYRSLEQKRFIGLRYQAPISRPATIFVGLSNIISRPCCMTTAMLLPIQSLRSLPKSVQTRKVDLSSL
jgi:SHS2 domain-containing protein